METLEKLKQQLQDCYLKSSGIFAEYELPDNEYLLVHFKPCDQGILFTGDFELETWFFWGSRRN